MVAQMNSRPTRSAATQTPSRKFNLADVQTEGRKLPARIVIQAVEGIGKTSMGAFSHKPIFMMSKGETGLETLMQAGRVPAVPHFPEIMSFSELESGIELLTNEDHDYKTLILDAGNGFERLCHEMVCARDFGNDWTDKGFMGYMRGYEVALADWRKMLISLDELREKRGMIILMLCHTRPRTFKNPEGADYDRYEVAIHPKTWEITHRWADVVMFGNFYTVVDEKKKKGAGGQDRFLYTVRTAAYDAKNRYGLPEEIEMGKSGKEAWDNFCAAMRAGKPEIQPAADKKIEVEGMI